MVRAICATALVAALAVAGDRVARAADAPELTCVLARAAPVYQGVGWTHFVDVVDACEHGVICRVATTVDPQPAYRIELRAGEATRVRTRYGSNTPVFEPIVECEPG